VLVTGCSGFDAEPKSAASGGASGSAAASPPPGSASGAAASGAAASASADNGAAQAGLDPNNLPKPIASLSAPAALKVDPKATLKIDILQLRRKDKLLQMTAVVTPKNTLAEPTDLVTLVDAFWRPKLIDTVNLKQYSVVEAGGVALQSNPYGAETTSGVPLIVYAMFPAPPPEIRTISIQFADTLPTLNDVPLG
jgi:hypothetical protein